jgi:F-type H+-transporting ATPase subunit delta
VPDRRRAWAAALFAAEPESARRRGIADALDGIAAAMRAGRELADFLRDPSVPASSKSALLASALDPSLDGDGRFARFCALAVAKGRALLLPAVAARYRALLDSGEGVSRLEVEAAREPDPAFLARLGDAWTRSAGARRTEIVVRINPALVAGYRLRAGSAMYDYSVAGRLERLRRELARPLGPGRMEG